MSKNEMLRRLYSFGSPTYRYKWISSPIKTKNLFFLTTNNLIKNMNFGWNINKIDCVFQCLLEKCTVIIVKFEKMCYFTLGKIYFYHVWVGCTESFKIYSSFWKCIKILFNTIRRITLLLYYFNLYKSAF